MGRLAGFDSPRHRENAVRGFFFGGGSLGPAEVPMDPDQFYNRYRELQSYVSWTDADAERIIAAAPLLEPYLQPLIDDFYEEIERHPDARKVITGGPAQIGRLKGTLVRWIRDLLAGRYDADYVAGRWRVGWRHVEIGLDQVYTNVALARLRTGLVRALHESWQGPAAALQETVRSLNKLLDLDLAIIEDAYQAEYMARLQRSERMATLGQVAGGVAHELRNPLNVVRTSVYYLMNARNPTPEKQADHLRRIERNVELADGVITALSNFAKIPAPNLQPIAVEPLVREALEINPPGRVIEVAVECPAELPHALGDADQLRIALGNLIRNARDAMPGGGRLAIAGRLVDGHVEVSVADTGVGIPATELDRVTEPLYSTKARGLGLGLAITRSIVEKNRGILRVASEPGQGSVFTIRLTAATGDGAAS
jgi:signal transduction histidine kinase